MRYLILTVALVLLAPVLARLEARKELRSWEAPQGALAAHRPLRLVVEESWAVVDVLRWYRSHRLSITDGGYAYFLNFEIADANPKKVVQETTVDWSANEVVFTLPDGVRWVFPAQAVMGRVGR